MSHGRYSDDPLEDSLLRDDELRMRRDTMKRKILALNASRRLVTIGF